MELSNAEDYEFVEQEIEPFSFSASPQQHLASIISQPPDVELQVNSSARSSQLYSATDHRSFPDYSSLSSYNAEGLASPLVPGEAPRAERNLIPAQNTFSGIKLLQISPLQRYDFGTQGANITATGTHEVSPQILGSGFYSSSSYNASYRVIGSPATESCGGAFLYGSAAQQVVASPSIMIPEYLAPRVNAYAPQPDMPPAYPYSLTVSAYGSQYEAVPEEYVSDVVSERREQRERTDLPFSVFPLLHISQADRLQPDEEFDNFASFCVDWERFAFAAKGARLSSKPSFFKAKNFIVNGVIVKGIGGDSLVNQRNQLVAPQKGFY